MARHRFPGALFAAVVLITSLVAVQPSALGAGRKADAMDVPGEVLWSRQDGTEDLTDRARALGVSPDGSTVFVSGESEDRFGPQGAAIVAYASSTGSPLWARRYARGSSSIPVPLAVSPVGSTVFVGGSSIIAYDGVGGKILWAAPDLVHSPIDMTPSPDGKTLFVVGDRTPGFEDGAIFALEASTGTVLWQRESSYTSYFFSRDLVSLAVSPDGSQVYVAGRRQQLGDQAIIALDGTTGGMLWRRSFSGWAHAGPAALGIAPDGSSVFVAESSGPEYITRALNPATGRPLWEAHHSGLPFHNDIPSDVGVSPDGSKVFVTGSSWIDETPYPASFPLTVAYDAATGVQLWDELYSEGGLEYDLVRGLAVAPDGTTVFVTANVGGIETLRTATVAYEAATGAEQWVGSFSGYGHDLGVAPDGSKLFVTGSSDGDLYTEAYATR